MILGIPGAKLARQVALAMVAVAVIACGGSTSSVDRTPGPTVTTPRPTQTATTVPAVTTAAPTATIAPSPLPTATSTATPLPTVTPTAVVVATQAPPLPSGSANWTIQATNFAFSPASIVVTSGQTVTIHFVNNDRGVPHNIAFNLSELQFTTPCEGGCEAHLTFNAPAPGQYSFNCNVHPYMTGTMTVN
jgi:plastocyanin